MSQKKLRAQKGYMSSSSQQQQQRKIQKVKLSNQKSMQKSIKGHSQNVEYSMLDKMSLGGDMAREENGSEEQDELRILDEQQESYEEGSQQLSQEEQQYEYNQQPTTPTASRVTSTQQLDPLQKKRLQIWKKLEQEDICSPEQYQSIISKLQQQNQKLQSDLQTLKQKVDLLKLKQMRKNKQKTKLQTLNYPQQQYKRIKTELNKKYQQLQKLQKKSHKTTTTQGLEIQYRQFVNKLIELQNTSQVLRASRKDEKKINKNLRNQLKKYIGTTLQNSPEAHQLETYNKQLKEKLFLMKKVISSQQQSQLSIHNFNIQMKQKQKKLAQIMRLQQLKRKQTQRKHILCATRLATLGAGEVQKIQTSYGVVKLYTVDSKVRARTEFSFQDNGIPMGMGDKLLVGRNHSALTQVANDTPKLTKKLGQQIKSNTQLSPQKPSLPTIQFTPLPSHEIATLCQTLSDQTMNLEHLSMTIHKRLNFLQQQLNPNYKRQGSSYIFSKEKDILMTNNNLLIEQLKSIQEKKIELMREYNIVEKYYGKVEQEEREMYNSTQMARREESAKDPTLPRISQVNEFNRSRSQMKFNNKNREQRTQVMRRGISSAGKSLKAETSLKKDESLKAGNSLKADPSLKAGNSLKDNRNPQGHQTNVKKSPSIPTYNNGRSQYVEKNLTKEQLEETHKKNRIRQEKRQLVEWNQIQTQAFLSFSCFNGGELKQHKTKPYPWKQDFIGEIMLQECHFDDRLYSSIHQHMFINQLTIHHTDQLVLFIQAKYKPYPTPLNQILNESLITTELSYALPVDLVQSALNAPNIVTSCTELSVNDYVKQVKVMYDVDRGQVVRLQVVSKFNVKYDFGNKMVNFPTALTPHLNINLDKNKDLLYKDKDLKKRSRSKHQDEPNKIIEEVKTTANIKYYAFDIKPNQYPSLMFGNYKITQDGRLILSGLGFTIHKQPK